MNNQPLEIVLTGPVGCGKTTAGMIIANALRQHGFVVHMEDDNIVTNSRFKTTTAFNYICASFDKMRPQADVLAQGVPPRAESPSKHITFLVNDHNEIVVGPNNIPLWSLNPIQLGEWVRLNAENG